jgi:hypothetical protein
VNKIMSMLFLMLHISPSSFDEICLWQVFDEIRVE